MRPRRTALTEGQPNDEALVDALGQCAFVVMGVLTKLGAEHDLSLTQLRALGILRDRTLIMSELADFLGLERSTMSGLIERAERRGLLQRGRNAADSRAIDVSMTAAGLGLAERVHADLQRALAPVTSQLSADERRLLTRLLQRMLSQREHPTVREVATPPSAPATGP